jgi:hypothetical protein
LIYIDQRYEEITKTQLQDIAKDLDGKDTERLAIKHNILCLNA